MWGPAYDWVPLDFLTLRLVFTDRCFKHSSGFPTPVPGFHGVFANRFLFLWVSFSVLAYLSLQFGGGRNFPYDHTFLSDLRKAVDFFQLVRIFTCWDAVVTSKLLTFCTRNQKSPSITFYSSICRTQRSGCREGGTPVGGRWAGLCTMVACQALHRGNPVARTLDLARPVSRLKFSFPLVSLSVIP